MYRQLAAVTIAAAAFAAGAFALGSDQSTPSSGEVTPYVQVAPAPVIPSVPTIEIDPNYIPQQMNFP